MRKSETVGTANRWEVESAYSIESPEKRIPALITLLLKNRGIETPEQREAFLSPRLETVTPETTGINNGQLQKALKRISKAVHDKEQIVVFGDYDVDGITGTAILWETLYGMNAAVIPYIPHRIDEGYGLSIKGITNLQSEISNIGLIITVDNGISANEAVQFANEQGIDVIVTDHHTIGENVPEAHAIVHTTNLCGAGVAYLLSKELLTHNSKPLTNNDKHLELATLGTIADLVPLVNANRTIAAHGLPKLAITQRPGLLALYHQAGIRTDSLGTYEVGFMIAPRLNAAGRMENAMDSLRLLCTRDKDRAELLASDLEQTNRERQQVMKESAEHAILSVRTLSEAKQSKINNLLIVAHESYQEGVIGLVAGKLVEAYYRPSIVIAKRETHSKASARSIAGFNIIEFLRGYSDHFVNIGGHPMAAGFTIETQKLEVLQSLLESMAESQLEEGLLTRRIVIDCKLPLSVITQDLYQALQKLAPFGMGNPEPVFSSSKVKIQNIRLMGKDQNHVKFTVRQDNAVFDAIGFNMAERTLGLQTGDDIDIVFTVDENTWNGNTKLQLKLKDFRKTHD